ALHDIESRAMHLEPSERALLVRHLIDSLDTEEEANVDKLWVMEAETRYQAYLKGEMTAIPADEVLARARKNLK
ncbi:MAG: addiction module protein, partial [Zetaproteobacteria bacterium CG_4_9_14_3_um_filter_53_7]